MKITNVDLYDDETKQWTISVEDVPQIVHPRSAGLGNLVFTPDYVGVTFAGRYVGVVVGVSGDRSDMISVNDSGPYRNQMGEDRPSWIAEAVREATGLSLDVVRDDGRGVWRSSTEHTD